MTETQFIERNTPKWKQLETYNKRLARGPLRRKSLSKDEAREFAGLFQAGGYHLSYAKTHFPESDTTVYLAQLLGVAHNHFYLRDRSTLSAAAHYLKSGFAGYYRDVWRYAAVAMALFLAGFLFAYAYVVVDPSFFRLFAMFEHFQVTQAGSGPEVGQVIWDYPLMSAVIMTNNINVAILAMVTGITFGLFTTWILFYNGMIVGALAAYVAVGGGDVLLFWSLILPHGVIELAAIFLSGGGGLLIGRAMIAPGRYRRRDALIPAARRAMRLVPGIVVMLVVGGLIEGFFTPLGIHALWKLGFAGLTLAALVVYALPFKKREPANNG